MKGFIFSATNTQLIIEGRKTQTRRVVKPQPVGAERAFYQATGADKYDRNRFHFLKGVRHGVIHTEDLLGRVKPRVDFDEVFYVKESIYRSASPFPGCEPEPIGPFGYYVAYLSEMTPLERVNAQMKADITLVNSRNVGADYARVFLRCTEVRCERIQEISAEDIEAELGWGVNVSSATDLIKECQRKGFQGEWDNINPEQCWERNPWVFVYSFTPAHIGPVHGRNLGFSS